MSMWPMKLGQITSTIQKLELNLRNLNWPVWEAPVALDPALDNPRHFSQPEPDKQSLLLLQSQNK